MIRYDLAQVVVSAGKRPKRDRVLLSPIAERYGTEKSYYRALRKMLSGLAQTTAQTVIPAYSSDRNQERLRRRLHDADESTFTPLKALQASLTRETSTTVNRILDLEAQRHTATFMQTARSALGVDLSAVVTQEDLTDYLRAAAARNTSLITSLSADVVKRVEQSVLAAGIRGDSVQALKKILTEQYAITDRRAQLIARDQTAKLNSDLTRIRQEQAGVDAYNWMTAHDERVRPLHKSIDGNEYQWGKPTGAEDGLPPGQPIQCRCIAQGIVTFGEPVKRTAAAPAPVPVLPKTPKPRRRRADPGPVQIEPASIGAPGVPIPKPGAPAGSALAQAETVMIRNHAADLELKDYVLQEGRARKIEFMDSYDSETGERIGRNSTGEAGHVGFTPEFMAAINDSKRKIIAHHNHPSSSSFSKQDMNVIQQAPGLKGLWAHGHNGSSYYAERVDDAVKTSRLAFQYQIGIDELNRKMQPLVTAGKITPADINLTFNHMVWLLAHARGYIKYSVELTGPTAEAWSRLQPEMEPVIQKLKETHL